MTYALNIRLEQWSVQCWNICNCSRSGEKKQQRTLHKSSISQIVNSHPSDICSCHVHVNTLPECRAGPLACRWWPAAGFHGLKTFWKKRDFYGIWWYCVVVVVETSGYYKILWVYWVYPQSAWFFHSPSYSTCEVPMWDERVLSHYSLFQFLWVCGWYGRMKVTTTPQRSEITKSCFLNQLSDFHLLLDFMELHYSHQLSGTVGTCRKVSCILSRSTPVVSEETIKLLHLRWLT